MAEQIRFTRDDTNIVKGLAILAMVFHHVCPNNCALSVLHWKMVDLQTILASSGKVCVALLTILSGYGLCESYKRFKDHSFVGGVRFSLSHYFQLMSLYWCLYIWAYVINSMQGIKFFQVYGQGMQGLVNMGLDLLGVSTIGSGRSLIGGWYLPAIVTFYFLFPLLHLIVRKIGWSAILIAYLPWIWYMYVGNLKMHTDWWPFYLVSFVIGIYLSQKGTLDRLVRLDGFRWSPIAVALFIGALALRTFITLPFDPVLAMSCVLLSIFVLRKIVFLRSLLTRLGMLSAGVWLLHLFMRSLIRKLSFETYWGRFTLLIFITVGIVLVIDEFKAHLKYGDWVRKVRGFIESGSERKI